MIKALFLLFLLTTTLQAEAPAWNAATRDAWWAEHGDPSTWRKAALSQMAELIVSYQPTVEGELSPQLTSWFNHVRWISLLSPDQFAESGLTVSEFRALGENELLSKTFLNERRSEDKVVEAVKILGQIYRSSPQDLTAYPVLAVAYALVFDQPFPDDWPHHQVKRETWEAKSGSAAERFAYYVELDKNKKLDFSPAALSFTELKFLVDTLVSREELTWASENVRTSLGSFDRVFGSINYDMSRLLGRRYDWPEGIPYTLAEIQQRGGICVDQAYFGATVGKARGIPTLYFSGQGADGGHAWYGYLKRNRTWDLDVGRYESQNYPVGEARDPQTWGQLNDEQLKNFTERVSQNPRYPAAEMLLFWATANKTQPFYKPSIDQVLSMAPGWLVVWRAQAEWMKSTQQPLDVQKEFYRQWSSQFSKLPDARVEGQARLLEVLKEAGDTVAAAQVQTDVVRQNRRKRFDLGIGAGMEPIFELLDKQDWKGAETEFKKLVRQFDSQGGGNLFYGVVRPFVSICLEEKQETLARESLLFASKKMKLQPDSILSMEFEKLSEKIGDKKTSPVGREM